MTLSVCLSVSVGEHISRPLSPELRVRCSSLGPIAPLSWMLCTSGCMDDAMFVHSG